jgi:hypothetical protein
VALRLVWDPPKRLANLDKHKLDFEDLAIGFFAQAVYRPAKRGRLQAIGYLNGRPVAVIFAMLGTEAISIISLRPAKPPERKLLDDRS